MTAFSPHLERRGSWEGWNPLLERAIRQAEQSGDLAAAVNLSTLLARLCQRQSRPADTICHYRRVMRLARQLNDAFSLGRACTNLGYLYIERGQWQRAEILCCCALTLFEWIHSDHGLAHTENHLGFLYIQQGLWEQAQQRLERACALWQVMGDNHGLMRGFINLGLLYNEMERPNEAIANLKKALQQAELTGEEVEIGKIYINIGGAYRLKGEFAQAEKCIWLAEDIFRRFSATWELANVQENLAAIYLDQHKLPEAYLYLEATLKALCSLNYKYGEIQTMIYLIKYELLRGNQQQAAAWLEETEHRLSQHDQRRQYYQLYRQIDRFRRNLTRQNARQAAAE
jgi:tetratricopeptide (TPR) repeat protein